MDRRIGLVIILLATLIVVAILYTPNKTGENSGWQPWKKYPGLSNKPIVFSYFPVDTNKVTEIWPLGHLNPPGHSIPTDHMYIFVSSRSEVRSPADGLIILTRYFSDEDTYSLTIAYNNTLTGWMQFDELSDKIKNRLNNLPIPIKAGEVIGYVNWGMDFGVYDKNINLHFIHPEKYEPYMIHTACPLDYFQENLKSFAYSKVDRTKEPRCGKIDYDQEGKLVGNWVPEGYNTAMEDAWKKQITFVYDFKDPTQIRIGIGEGLKIPSMVYAIEGNAPDPADITPSSGKVVYKLRGTDEFGQQNIKVTLLVEMVDNNKIKVEGFTGWVSNPKFTEEAKYYHR